MSYFYEGLIAKERQFIEMMCNGKFFQKEPEEAIEYMNQIAEKAHTVLNPVLLRAQIGLDPPPLLVEEFTN